MERVCIVGSALGGGALQIIDALRGSASQNPAVILDNNPNTLGQMVCGVPVIGSSTDIKKIFDSRIFDSAIVAVGSLSDRKKIFDLIVGLGIPVCNVIDRLAVVSASAQLGFGNVVLAQAYIGPSVKVGNNCYFLPGSRVNHDSEIEDHCYFASGANLGGRVRVSSGVKFELMSGARSEVFVPEGSVVQAGHII